MYEHCFRNLDFSIRSRLRRCRVPMVGFSGETYHPLGIIDLQVTVGRTGRNKTVLMEFAIIKCRSPYNVIIGRIGMRSLGAVGSSIHSMTKFPTNQGIVTMETSREALWECRQLKGCKAYGMSLVLLAKTWDKEDTEEVCIVSHERPDRCITIGTTLTAGYKQLLTDVLQENKEVFAWAGSERTTVSRFVMEHQLKIYPFVEPMAHKRRLMASKGRLALKEKVFHWLKEGLIRKVQCPEWIANTILVKLANST
ncbi:hypothetical protein Tco_0420890 [Tanacetum coccineum]